MIEEEPQNGDSMCGSGVMNKMISVLLVGIFSIATNFAVASAMNDAPITASGDYTFTLNMDGYTRQYFVHVPNGYAPSKPAPVIFAFHGGGGSMMNMADDDKYGLITKSNQTGFIMVFPNGFSRLPSGKMATWNGGSCCGEARDRNIDDVGFVRAIYKKITQQLNIDKRKVYAIGMSNGGILSYRLACEASDIFKAIASVAGTEGVKSCQPKKPISILHIHAVDDDHVLFNGGAGEGAFRDVSKVTNFTSVPVTIHNWLVRDGCAKQSQRILSVQGAYCDLYAPCAGQTKVQLCVTESGGHSWPGGNKPRWRRSEQPSKAISANDQIWKFFQSLPE